jgi:predicted enzyme involved in methoxymalonyl-ACP biosynthesis
LSTIKVTIDDINRPIGCKDKHCCIVIHTIDIPDVDITDNQTSEMSAVNISLSRARITLLRKVKSKQNNTPIWAEKLLDEYLQKYANL